MTTEHDFPLTVPGESDVQCWELRGGADGHLKSTQPVPLPAEYAATAVPREAFFVPAKYSHALD